MRNFGLEILGILSRRCNILQFGRSLDESMKSSAHGLPADMKLDFS